MTKGNNHFFSKAGNREGWRHRAVGSNVYVQGDKLTMHIDKTTNLYLKEILKFVG
jgi:alkylated DNA repair dioxygenase AlkB